MASPFDKTSPLFRHRQLAPTASVRVSPLCLGTMTFGTAYPERYGHCSKEEAFAIMDTFYSQGGNFLDTANVYRDGASEEWIGEWMSLRQNRDDLVLATKFTSGYQSHHPEKLQSNYIGNSTKSMKLSVEASLKKLQTTYIDILYVHWWDSTTTIPELMHSLNDLVVAGKVLYLGVSDTPAWIVSMANEYARSNGLRPFVIYQGLWNAGIRDFERDIVPMCVQQGMALAPYGVLGQGRWQTEEAYEAREKAGEGRSFQKLSDHDRHIAKVLSEVAASKSSESDSNISMLNVALAYIMQKVPYVFPIVGQRKVSHLEDSVKGLEVELSEEDVEKIENAYHFDHGFPHTFLSGSMFDGSRPRQVKSPGDIWLLKLQGAGTIDWVDGVKAIRSAVPEGKK